MPPIEPAEKVLAAAVELTADAAAHSGLTEKLSTFIGWFGRRSAAGTAEASEIAQGAAASTRVAEGASDLSLTSQLFGRPGVESTVREVGSVPTSDISLSSLKAVTPPEGPNQVLEIPALPHELAASSFKITSEMQTQVGKLEEVAPGRFHSALPTEKGLELMKEAGLNTVVVLRHSPADVAAEKAIAERLGLKFVHIKTNGETALTPEMVKQFNQVLDDPDSGNILWHCVHGRERTGAFTALFRMTKQGWSNERALKEAVGNGFRAEAPQFQPLLASLRAYPKFIDAPTAEATQAVESGLNLPNK